MRERESDGIEANKYGDDIKENQEANIPYN